MFDQSDVVGFGDSGEGDKEGCKLESATVIGVIVGVDDHFLQSSALSFVNGHGKCKLKGVGFFEVCFGQWRQEVSSAVTERLDAVASFAVAHGLCVGNGDGVESVVVRVIFGVSVWNAVTIVMQWRTDDGSQVRQPLPPCVSHFFGVKSRDDVHVERVWNLDLNFGSEGWWMVGVDEIEDPLSLIGAIHGD